MKRYEGLFILDLAGREEGLNEAIDKVKALLTEAGAKVDTVQKLEKKAFARVTDKKVTGGHFVNVTFEATTIVMVGLPAKFAHESEVYRVQFNIVPKNTPAYVPAPAVA